MTAAVILSSANERGSTPRFPEATSPPTEEKDNRRDGGEFGLLDLAPLPLSNSVVALDKK